MIPANQVARLQNAIPFWMSLTLVPVAWFSAVHGGWAVILLPLCTWYLFSLLDAILGLNKDNADPETAEDQLNWYKLITITWAPIQSCVLFGMIWYATGPGDAHLSPLETILLFFGVGVITGTVGINYSHELMHQKDSKERFLGDVLLSMVLYS
ncbi:MAG: alkane 1-monooxygenase, partial [Pseudomonadota bacterium]